jgi:hypothetical protein
LAVFDFQNAEFEIYKMEKMTLKSFFQKKSDKEKSKKNWLPNFSAANLNSKYFGLRNLIIPFYTILY